MTTHGPVISRFFADQWAADVLPPGTRTDRKPEYLVKLKQQRERARRKASVSKSSPLVTDAPSRQQTAPRPTRPGTEAA